MPRSWTARRGVRLGVAGSAALLVVGPLAWMWRDSVLPTTYSAMNMGYADFGGGPGIGGEADPGSGHAHVARSAAGDRSAAGPGTAPVSVTDLVTDRDRIADVAVTLTARAEPIALASGRTVDGYTLNRQSPGPEIRVRVGQLLEVRFVNESVPSGATLHWHGVDLPNGEDGVAGITQDAVAAGEEHVYRFLPAQAGTYWYHSHQVSHEQVRGGLLGALVVEPEEPRADAVDMVAVMHLYDGMRTVNGADGDLPVALEPGQAARVRVINTDNGPTPVWVAGAPYRVLAVDGRDINGPTPVTDEAVLLTAGGRADIAVTAPEDGSAARVHLGGPTGVVLGGSGSAPVPTEPRPAATLDLLAYGTPRPLGFDPDLADRTFTYDIGRRPGFLDGRPGVWWTINGHVYPDVPMFTVSEGDVVRMTIANHSGEVHPMHLHGHHAVVLSRNGVPATGSPWWTDSLNVAHGESYEVGFVADNPGIWMDHCHNLPHASEGLVTHLMYTGVTTPFRIGGQAANEPE